LKALKFIINSHIFIALAAVSLTLATQVELGMSPEPKLYLAIIFFATLLDYNFHRLITLTNKNGNALKEKYEWAAIHLPLLKILIIVSLSGLIFTLFFANGRTIILLGLMAILTLLYSKPASRDAGKRFPAIEIPGLKSLFIALVWAVVTVYLPIIQSEKILIDKTEILLFAERLSFIFALTIPFDIRDMKEDELAGLRTIPIAFGEKIARKISVIALFFSLCIATIHYVYSGMIFIIPAYSIFIAATLVLMNNRKLEGLPNYYHGLLDGSMILYGVLLCLSYYLKVML
jgi:4-hydroxybenzoate polyprenyltransferase